MVCTIPIVLKPRHLAFFFFYNFHGLEVLEQVLGGIPQKLGIAKPSELPWLGTYLSGSAYL